MDRDIGFVLKSTAYQERDLIISLFTEKKGKISAIARNGVQSRRFGGSLDFFLASEFEMDPKSIRLADATDEALIQLLSAQPKHSIRGVAKSLEKLSAGSCMNELLLRTLPPSRAAVEMFKLYSNALTAMDENEDSRAIMILNAFILKLAQWLGVQPALTRCASCSKMLTEIDGEFVRPIVSKGAWICMSCKAEGGEATRFTISRPAIADALLAMSSPIRKIEWVGSSVEHRVFLEYLEQHLAFFVAGMDKELSSTRFLKSLPPL
ncbi:MAG: DNA repair protein RecO [Bdellovibrionales bacterium]|nr:DNA repair protein RecO [Bdellovibrionales bacterium]